MKRRVRERVVGVSVEDDGEDVDGAGRELIVVVVWPFAGRHGDGGRQADVTGWLSQKLSHEIGCASCRIFIPRKGKERPRGRGD
jgi:hypothetical protein